MGEKGLPTLHPKTVGGRENCQPRRRARRMPPPPLRGECGLLRPNSRVGGGQTTQPWVSPDTVPPFRLVGTSLELQRAHTGAGAGLHAPLAAGDPPRARSGLVGQHSAIPSLVRKSFKLAVEEWKVGNQTGSFLEGVFLSFVMVFLIITTITVFLLLLRFWFCFSSLFLSESIPSSTFLGCFFCSCLSPRSPGHFWLGWLVKKWGKGPPRI